MLDLKIIEQELKRDIDLKDIAATLRMRADSFYRNLRDYEVEIIYKKHMLRKELIDYLHRNNMEKLTYESRVDQKALRNMQKKEGVSYRSVIRLLLFFDIDYKVNLVVRKEIDKGKAWKTFIVDFPKKSEYELRGKEISEGMDKRGQELYSHLISSHMNKLNIVMRNQQIGMITQDRIKHIVLDIIRESINLGTIVERNQDKEIIDVLSKAIKQGKVLDIDKDVL